MKSRFIASCVLVGAALSLAACDDGRQAPAKTLVRVANVAPGFAELTFRREQDSRGAATMQFKSTQEFVYDVDTYDFYVTDRTLTPDVPNREWAFQAQLTEQNRYLIVLTEVGTEVQPLVIEAPTAPPADAEFLALHAAGGQPAMDLYLERPGVGIAGATPRGSFNVQEQIPRTGLPNGDYVLTLTAAGDPTNVLLTTQTINLPATSTAVFIVVPEGGQGTADMSVMMLVQGTATVFYSTDSTSELRVINGATDRAPRDFAIDSQFSPPLFSATQFAEPTAYATVPLRSDVKVNVTPVGNPGVLELDQTYATVATQQATLLFSGDAGTLEPVLVADDNRRFHTEAKLRFGNVATQWTAVELVLTNPGVDPNLVAPLATNVSGALSAYLPLPPGTFDLYFREFGTLNYLAGPTSIELAAGGIYGVLSADGADTATAEPFFFDDFP